MTLNARIDQRVRRSQKLAIKQLCRRYHKSEKALLLDALAATYGMEYLEAVAKFDKEHEDAGK